MSNSIKYMPIVKTGDAEMRGLEYLSDKVKNTITPLVELTRSRSTKKKPRGEISKRVERLIQAYGNRRLILDLTSIPDLSNEEIENLLSSNDGYNNWVTFIDNLRDRLPKLIPIIQVKEDVEDIKEIEDRLRKQVRKLSKCCEKMAYRISVMDEAYLADLNVMKKAIPDLGDNLICIIDCDFVGRHKGGIYATRAVKIIQDLTNIGINDIVVAATSFPKNPTEYGGHDYGKHDLEEVSTYMQVQRAVRSDIKKRINLVYGDYANINPNRNDQKGGNAWVPRIDVPMEGNLFYYRSKRDKKVEDYTQAYTRVARKVINDKNYKNIRAKIGACWGIEQIESAATGGPQGLTPGFWISVRMNIHITLQALNRA